MTQDDGPTKTEAAKQRRYLFVSAGILLIAGLALFCLQAEVELTCDRSQPNQGTCQLLQTNLLHTATTEIPLASLRGASLQEQPRRGRETVHRVVLLTGKQEEVPMTGYLASDLISPYAEKQAIVAQVNEFVSTAEKTALTVRLDDRWFFQTGAVVLLVSSLVFSLLAWRSTG